MLEELKKIKLAEIDEKISNIKRQTEQTQKYNWFERIIFKKKEYELYIKKMQESARKNQLEIESLESQKEKYMNALYIQQLDLDLTSAIELLQKHGISEIITKEDKEETKYKLTQPNIDSLDGLILVHKTNYVPSKGRINSVKEAEVYDQEEIKIADQNIPIKTCRSRNTVHFAVNGEVQEHIEGNNWNEAKYAVLIPFTDIPREQYANVFANDTYTKGGVQLTEDSWILVPKGESGNVRKNNPGVNVIEYDGPNVTGYADKMVRLLGYNHQRIDPGAYGGWRDAEDNNKFTELMVSEGFSIGIHNNSNEQYQEKFERAIQIITQLMKYVEMHPELLSNLEFVEQLTKKFESQLIYTNGSPKKLCEDIYNHMMSESYALSEEKIMTLSGCSEQYSLGVQCELAYELINTLLKKNQMQLEQTQGIKK